MSGRQPFDAYTSTLYLTGSTVTSTTTSCLGFPLTSTSSPWSVGSVPAAMAWSQTVPTYMPWAAPSPTEQCNEVMRFTAPPMVDPCTSQTATAWELVHNLGSTAGAGQQHHRHLKRRCEIDDDRPHKQYVTEEKMVAQLNNLHISLMNQVAGATTSQVQDVGDPLRGIMESSLAATDMQQEEAKGGIILAPELKDIVNTDRLATESIIGNMRKAASMALVVWQPPSKILSVFGDCEERKQSDGAEETNNNEIADDSLEMVPSSSGNLHPSTQMPTADQAYLFDSMDDTMEL